MCSFIGNHFGLFFPFCRWIYIYIYIYVMLSKVILLVHMKLKQQNDFCHFFLSFFPSYRQIDRLNMSQVDKVVLLLRFLSSSKMTFARSFLSVVGHIYVMLSKGILLVHMKSKQQNNFCHFFLSFLFIDVLVYMWSWQKSFCWSIWNETAKRLLSFFFLSVVRYIYMWCWQKSFCCFVSYEPAKWLLLTRSFVLSCMFVLPVNICEVDKSRFAGPYEAKQQNDFWQFATYHRQREKQRQKLFCYFIS